MNIYNHVPSFFLPVPIFVYILILILFFTIGVSVPFSFPLLFLFCVPLPAPVPVPISVLFSTLHVSVLDPLGFFLLPSDYFPVLVPTFTSLYCLCFPFCLCCFFAVPVRLAVYFPYSD